jgi:hypothetical protein
MTTAERNRQNQDPDPTATGTDSSENGGVPISLDDSTVDALLNNPAVVAKIEAIAEAKAQGSKDRPIAKLENQFNDMSGLLDQLDLTPAQMAKAKEIERDNLLKQLTDRVLGETPDAQPVPQGSSAPPPASGPGGKPVDVVGSFKAVGSDPSSITKDDFDFASQFTDEVSLKNALLQKRLEIEQAQNQNTVDGAVMPQSGQAPTRDAMVKLQNEYESRLAQIRPGNADAIAQLKVEFRKKGLNIN